METLTIYVHGASKGSPGPAAIGLQIVDGKGEVIEQLSESVGNASDEYAENFAVMKSLQLVIDIYADKTKKMSFELKLSNQSVKEQLNNEAVITNPGLVPLFIGIHNMTVTNFPNIAFSLVKGKENKSVVDVVKEMLD